jgi:hypothetical protein
MKTKRRKKYNKKTLRKKKYHKGKGLGAAFITIENPDGTIHTGINLQLLQKIKKKINDLNHEIELIEASTSKQRDHYTLFDNKLKIKDINLEIKNLESCIKNIYIMKDCPSDIMREFVSRNSNTPSDKNSRKKDPSSHQLRKARTAPSSQLQRAPTTPSNQLRIASTAPSRQLRRVPTAPRIVQFI